VQGPCLRGSLQRIGGRCPAFRRGHVAFSLEIFSGSLIVGRSSSPLIPQRLSNQVRAASQAFPGRARRGLCLTQSAFSSLFNLPRSKLGNYAHISYQCDEVSLKIMSTSPARLASLYRPGFVGNHVTRQLSTQIDLSEDHRVPRARSESTLTSSLRPCTKGRTATCK
jgi:hypothetical protein